MRSFLLFGGISSVPSQPKRKRGTASKKCDVVCNLIGKTSVNPPRPSIKKPSGGPIGRRARTGVTQRKQVLPDEVLFAIVDLRAKKAKIYEIQEELGLTRIEIRRAYHRMGLHLK